MIEEDITNALGYYAARAAMKYNNADVWSFNYGNGKLTASIGQASSISKGFLSDTDWNTFNNKQNALTTGGTYLITSSWAQSVVGNVKVASTASVLYQGKIVDTLEIDFSSTAAASPVKTLSGYFAARVNGLDAWIPFYT